MSRKANCWDNAAADTGAPHRWRRIILMLDEPTREGDIEIAIHTNVPKEDASALDIARLYRRRWTIEHAFQELAKHLNSEINTLGYPPAALFAFCLALVAYNILAVVKAALRAVHGTEKIEREVSGYYLANEIANTYRGMMIAIEPKQWDIFRAWTVPRVADLLVELAEKVNLRVFKKHPRGPKKKTAKRKWRKDQSHVSTARLIAKRNAP